MFRARHIYRQPHRHRRHHQLNPIRVVPLFITTHFLSPSIKCIIFQVFGEIMGIQILKINNIFFSLNKSNYKKTSWHVF